MPRATCLAVRTGFLLIAGLGMLATLSGCAAYKASQQPNKKDLGVLHPGVPRTHVIAELGQPVWSDQRDGTASDVFAFKQGYSKPVKAGRALVHGAADVVTFGLWEVVGIPFETLADGTDVQVEVRYDARQTVESIHVIRGQESMARERSVAKADPPSGPTSRLAEIGKDATR